MRRATQTVWVSICLLSLLLHVTHLVTAAAALDQRAAQKGVNASPKSALSLKTGRVKNKQKPFKTKTRRSRPLKARN